ncbi:hypothetical protein ACO0SA_004793 [Hanseniaspora valbyensis]
MVDFPCYKFQLKITSTIDNFNKKHLSTNKLYISQTITSDELQSLPRKEAETKLKPFLNLIIKNLSSYYIKFSEQMYDIPATNNNNEDNNSWVEAKMDEMISTTGLFYMAIKHGDGENHGDDDDITVGFLSFLLTQESITGDKKHDRILYLMEIHLDKFFSGKGTGFFLVEDFLFELCFLLKMDLEFVCFKENDIGNKFYKKMGIDMLEEKKYPQLNFWFEFLNVYRMENKLIETRQKRING